MTGLKKFSASILMSLLVATGCTQNLPTGVDTGSNGTVTQGRKPEKVPLPFKTEGDYLAVRVGEQYKPLFIKGMNLATAIPGENAADLSISKDQYIAWFKRMKEIGVNTIRVYTMHRPQFYHAIEEFNLANSNDPMYFLHGIWFDEENPTRDLFNVQSGFQQEIKDVVDVVHGNKSIGHRFGKAFGDFKWDISPWVIGWIIGREIIYDEIDITDKNHPGRTSFDGKKLSISNATASEVWTTENLDLLLSYEEEKYKVQRPVSQSSWPTLDPLEHPTEPVWHNEDNVSINLNKINLKNAPGGLFASYHAYPYYPDFINDTPAYQQFRDEMGVNNYLGYLTDLKNHYKNMPLLIGEIGVPTSFGNAHTSPSGMHHGGHDEVAQGNYNARLMKNIYNVRAAGGAYFAWIDEWWKRTWIVDELTMPRDRYNLWHDYTSPEQNFGLIKFVPENTTFSNTGLEVKNGSRIEKIENATDASFFHSRIYLNSPLQENERIIIGFDTYRDDLGESILPNGVKTSQRSELALDITVPGTANLMVTEAYDLFGIWHGTLTDTQQLQSSASDGKTWNLVKWKNLEAYRSDDQSLSVPERIHEIGKLRVRSTGQAASSLDAVILNNNIIEVRIPWTLLQFTDPSRLEVLHDNRNTVGRETTVSEGIALAVSTGNSLVETQRFHWAPWNVAPPVKQEEKKSVDIIKNALDALPDYIN